MITIKLAVVGSRTFKDYDKCKEIINEICNKYKYEMSLIVSGGAKGADSFGEQYAKENNIETLIFKPNWNKYGKRAGFIRNEDIINNCDVCICFWDGESHGAEHDIKLCSYNRKKCFVYNFITNKKYRYDFDQT